MLKCIVTAYNEDIEILVSINAVTTHTGFDVLMFLEFVVTYAIHVVGSKTKLKINQICNVRHSEKVVDLIFTGHFERM